MLHVYNDRASSGDFLSSSSLRMRGRYTQGTDAPRTSTARPQVEDRLGAAPQGTEETDGSDSVRHHQLEVGVRQLLLRVPATAPCPTDASVEVKKGTTVCSFHRCTLDYNRTNSIRGEGEARENTITVTVTAENGYDDHEYTLMVMPSGADRRRIDEIWTSSGSTWSTARRRRRLPSDENGRNDGKTVARAFTMETKNPTGSSMNMRIDLDDAR